MLLSPVDNGISPTEKKVGVRVALAKQDRPNEKV
jgi:hypothetical protein